MGIFRHHRLGARSHNEFAGHADTVVQASVVHGDVVVTRTAPPDPGHIADLLAAVVRRQWEAEAAVRSLRRPEPLRLCWADTDRRVSYPSTAGLGSGDLDDLGERFASLPDRQLVILGGPGTGKSATALLLTLDLLARRGPGEPVPVLLALSSWNPHHDHLEDWIVRRLETDYAALRNRRVCGRHAARRMVAEQRVVPVLDGLDELPEHLLVPALEAVHRAFGPGRPLVLTCRGDEYESAVRAGGTALPAAAVVELEPVAVDDAIRFVSDSLPQAVERWAPVLDHLRETPGGVLAQALSTPLTVNLTRTVYARPGRDPAELVDTRLFDHAADVERHLLDSLLTEVYGDPPAPSPRLAPLPLDTGRRYPADRARRWLRFLARTATGVAGGDIVWWRLPRPRAVLVLVATALLLSAAVTEGQPIASGFAIGFAITWLITVVRRRVPLRNLLLTPVVFGVAAWFVTYQNSSFGDGAAAGVALALLVVLALSATRPPHRISLRVRGRGREIAARMGLGLLTAAMVVLAASVGHGSGGSQPWRAALVLGLIVFVAFGLGAWLTAPPDRFSVPGPDTSLRGDIAATAVWLLAWVGAWVLAVVAAAALGNRVDPPEVVAALAFGLGAGLGSVINNASVVFAASLAWWALRGRLP